MQSFRARHAKSELALFFGLGLLFDVFTLSPIDDWLSVIQQGLYLSALGLLLVFETRSALGVAEPPRWLLKGWRFAEDAIHFLFGSLLSVYGLQYLKSASNLAALGFLGFLFALLVANELPRFRRLGPSLRWGLYALCLTSYFAYLGPVIFGFISPWLFALAALVALVPFYFFLVLLQLWRQATRKNVLKLVAPGVGVQSLLVALYFAGAIPPVPLSVEQMGVYHGVERDGGGYNLSYLKSKWRFWQRGEREFLARPGDRIYCFVRVFAPNRFQDEVKLRWSYLDAKRGWVSWDAIPLVITGGRKEGFRGYAYKERYVPGKWKVALETADGREVGSLKFNLRQDASLEPRDFSVERI